MPPEQPEFVQNPLEWYSFETAFSDPEIASILELARTFPEIEGGVLAENAQVHAVRKSRLRWMLNTPATQWIYHRFFQCVNEANTALWQFNPIASEEPIQYAEYHADGGHFHFHLDLGPKPPLNRRKISVTLQLTGPDEYEGGDFQILSGTDAQTLPKRRGTVLLFPSYLLHRVTPVTAGTRKSLVIWIGGGPYR